VTPAARFSAFAPLAAWRAGCGKPDFPLLDQRFFEPSPVPPTTAQVAATQAGRGPPLVTISFDQPNPDYRPALAAAVQAAQARKPDVAFDVVTVTTPAGSEPTTAPVEAEDSAALGRQEALGVARALIALGVGPSRITLGASKQPGLTAREVRVYVR
jgi:hypothetical protein